MEKTMWPIWNARSDPDWCGRSGFSEDEPGAKQIRELGIRARETLEICKAELREENQRWIEWRVRKTEAPRHPASSGNVSEGAGSDLDRNAQNQGHGTAHQTARPLDFEASPDGTLLPVLMTGAGITAMELAMSGATDVARRVESRGSSLKVGPGAQDILAHPLPHPAGLQSAGRYLPNCPYLQAVRGAIHIRLSRPDAGAL
jgi:hypothetical protein